MSYISLRGWVKGCPPGLHARHVLASIKITGEDKCNRNTYTNGSLTETTKALPAFLSLSLLM